MSICNCESCGDLLDLDSPHSDNISVSDDGMSFLCEKCSEEEEE